jgi:hypothetical protein
MGSTDSGNGKGSQAQSATIDVGEILEPALVAPIRRRESGFNTIRSGLIPKGCFTIEDSHFEFDSSFVLPLGLTFDAQPLKKLMDDHPGSKLSIFGHTDPVGKDSYNKTLSGRRAQAIFGLLTRNVELWKDLYFHHDTLGNDPWGVRSIQVMLNFVGPTKAGNTQGILDDLTRQALKDFEEAKNPPAKGFNKKQEVDPGTFEVLAKLYMDTICTDDDNNPVQFTPDDFLARGAGKDGKGDFQGCGEFNPLMMLSKDERAFFDQEQNKSARNKENQVNRRIMILLYRTGARVEPEKWPCPSVKEGPEKCQARFFTNAKERRSNLEQRREHKDEPNNPDQVGTFACRFYERQTSDSPCEGNPVETAQLFMQCFSGDGRVMLAGHKYTITKKGDTAVRFRGTMTDSGTLRHQGVPPDEYELHVEGCAETSPMAMLPPGAEEPQIRMLENGRLAIHVLTADGDPISEAKVAIDGVGEETSDADGVAYFAALPEGTFNFTVSKPDHKPAVPDDTKRLSLAGDIVQATVGGPNDDTASGSADVKDRRKDVVVALKKDRPPARILRIEVTQPVTQDLRNATKPDRARPVAKLTPSLSTETDMGKNPPVVLIRGSHHFFLKAITEPAEEPVTWEIKANQTKNPPPNFDPKKTVGDFAVEVETNTTGSFSAVGTTTNGVSMVWNFVLVGVDLEASTPPPVARDSGLVDLNEFMSTPEGKKTVGLSISSTFNPTAMTGAATGLFEQGKHAWFSEVHLKLKGGGPGEDIGCDKVDVQILQNLTDVTVRGVYKTKIAFYEVALPILDVSPGSPPGYDGPSVGNTRSGSVDTPQTPFLFSEGMVKHVKKDPTQRIIQVGDAPGMGFDTKEEGTREQLTKITGGTRFRAAVASFSKDNKDEIVAHADQIWEVDYSGDVEVELLVGKWKKNGAGVKIVQPWKEIASSSGVKGTDAMSSLLEIFPPRAIDITNAPKKIINKA